MLIIILCAFTSGCNIYVDIPSKYSKRIANLVYLTNSGVAADAMKVFDSLNNDELDELVDFLDKYPEKLPPFFYMSIADHIYKTDKDKAVEWYYIGALRALEDAFACKDTTARRQIGIYPMLAPDTVEYGTTKFKDADYKYRIIKKAVNWDIAHSKRYDPIWACYHGIEAFEKQPQVVSYSERKKIISYVRSRLLSRIEAKE